MNLRFAEVLDVWQWIMNVLSTWIGALFHEYRRAPLRPVPRSGMVGLSWGRGDHELRDW